MNKKKQTVENIRDDLEFIHGIIEADKMDFEENQVGDKELKEKIDKIEEDIKEAKEHIDDRLEENERK